MMQKMTVTLPEGTTTEMHTAKFWARRMTGPGKRWFSGTQVDHFNKEILEISKMMALERFATSLEDFSLRMEVDAIRSMIGEAIPEVFLRKSLTGPDGEEVPVEIRDDIIENATTIISHDMVIPLGLTIRRTHLRAMPTDLISAGDYIDNDNLQLTSVSLATPFALLARSRDNFWFFVQTSNYRGWLKADHVAIAKDRREVLSFAKAEPFLLAAGNRVEIEPDPFVRDSDSLFLQMGDTLPAAKSFEAENLHAQGPYGCYCIKIPCRDRKGFLEFRTGLIRSSEDVHSSTMKLTSKNIFRQAFKMLGERYGWGGAFNRRDCSRFVQDIFRCFGVELPRDSWVQEKLNPAPAIVFSGDLEERKKQLASLRPGNPLYMPGHTMIYLGQAGGDFYAIHDGSGYKSGKGRPVSVHGVFVMPLSLNPMKGEKSYLEMLTSAPEMDRWLEGQT